MNNTDKHPQYDQLSESSKKFIDQVYEAQVAWDCTYGKGINPESVEKMKDTLEYLLEWTDEQRQKVIQEALTASKLT